LSKPLPPRVFTLPAFAKANYPHCDIRWPAYFAEALSVLISLPVFLERYVTIQNGYF